jgi:hypothetical protein
MKRGSWCILLLMIAFTTGACTDELVIPCYDNSDRSCDRAERIPPVGAEDLVCNEAVSLEEACQDLLDSLPPQIPIPEVCQYIPPLEIIGTCQPPGMAGDPCAEDDDCEVELVCNLQNEVCE